MSEITPPPPPPASPSMPLAAQPKVTVANPPDAMARQLSLGARLDAVIAASAPKGKILIDTAFGRFAIQTGFPLPKDGALQLQLQAKGPILRFLITSIHGMPPKTALRALGLVPGAAGQGGGAAAAGNSAAVPDRSGPVTRLPPAVNLSVGVTLSATMAKAPAATPGAGPGQGAAGGAPGTTPPGPGQAATPQGRTPPSPGQAASGTGSRGAAARGQPGAAAATPGASASPSTGAGRPPGQAPSAAVQPAPVFSIRITAFQPAAATAAAGGLPPAPASSAVLAPGTTLTGLVTGATVSGHPVVQTHAGTLVIATRAPVPAGSTVTFEVLSQSAAPATAAGPAPAHAFLSPANPGERWPALDEAVRILQDVNPAAAQQLVQAVLPRPGPALAGNILFYLMALSGGDLRGWFGDGPARALQKVNPNLWGRLRDDFGQIERTARAPDRGEWRTTMIPIHNGAEIDPVRLSLRTVGEDSDDGQKDAIGTRFVVDLDLSRMGRFQLDGFVHQGEKRMDLIVRTENKLPRTLENGIRGIFQEAVEVTGIKGGIVFQAAPPNFINIPGTAPADESLGLIV